MMGAVSPQSLGDRSRDRGNAAGGRSWIHLGWSTSREFGTLRGVAAAGQSPESPERFALVVDDDLDYTRLVIEMLKSLGVPAYHCTLGERVLVETRRLNPSLVMLDVMMPGVHGLFILRQLKADPATRHIPVIINSSLVNPGLVEQALAAGAFDYIGKESRPRDILERLRRALGR